MQNVSLNSKYLLTLLFPTSNETKCFETIPSKKFSIPHVHVSPSRSDPAAAAPQAPGVPRPAALRQPHDAQHPQVPHQTAPTYLKLMSTCSGSGRTPTCPSRGRSWTPWPPTGRCSPAGRQASPPPQVHNTTTFYFSL